MRPGYPAEVIARIAAGTGGEPHPVVCDLGAGTGKLSRALLNSGLDVIAVDPDAESLARNPARGRLGGGEDIPLPDSTLDCVTVAQAWHWMDPVPTAAEIARVLRAGGAAWILLNQLDVRTDWVLRLSRIMHAGDVYRPHWRPVLGRAFGPVEATLAPFTTPATIEDIVGLASTRSYWLRSSPAVRRRVEANLRWFFTHEQPLAEGEAIDLPYLCLAYRATRLADGDPA